MTSPDQLSLYYQPRIDLQTGQCKGAEALLWWHNPQLGAISPAEFAPLAEQTALITLLTHWVMNHAMMQNRNFLDARHLMRVSINASTINLSEDGFDDVLYKNCSFEEGLRSWGCNTSQPSAELLE